MNRKGAYAVAVALIAIACFGFERASFAQVAKQKTSAKRTSAPSNGKPTAADTKAVIEKQISRGRFKVTSITKTNGAELSMGSQYQIFYTVRVTCLVSEGKRIWPIVDYGTTEAITCENEGDVRAGTGYLYFFKTEQGWKLMGSDHRPGWFEAVKGGYQPASDKDIILVPIPKGNTKAPARPSESISAEYNRFLGVWSYAETDGYSTTKSYFRITRDQRGRFQFDEGWNDDPKVVSKITWSRDVLILTNADGIFLKPSKGNLLAKFVSANFRATHGHDFTYQITLQFQANGTVLYLLGGDLSEKHVATKVSGN